MPPWSIYIRVFICNESISSGPLNPVMTNEVIRHIITLYIIITYFILFRGACDTYLVRIESSAAAVQLGSHGVDHDKLNNASRFTLSLTPLNENYIYF